MKIQYPVVGTDGNKYIPYEERTGAESVVFFTRDLSEAGLQKIYDKVGSVLTGKVAVKLHTGEAEGPNILPRPWVKELLASRLPEATIIETNTYYEGSRYTTEAHRETLKVNGWDFCPVDITDSTGVTTLPVKDGKWFEEMHVGKTLPEYDSLLALTHFKGHTMGGFGGSNKNIGIGCADGRIGKKEIHTREGSDNMWSIAEEEFMERMTESTKATIDHFADHVCFINTMRNMSVDCDCAGPGAAPVETPDIGILASLDILAVDNACIDLIYHLPNGAGKHMIERVETRHGLRQLSYMKEMGMGNDRYTLIDLDHDEAVITAAEAVKDVAPEWKPDRYNTFWGRNAHLRTWKDIAVTMEKRNNNKGMWPRCVAAGIALVIGVVLVYSMMQPESSVVDAAYQSAAYATIWSVVPPLLAILLALITKEVYSSLLAGIAVGALLYANGNVAFALQSMLYDENGGLVPNVATTGHSGILIFCGMLFTLVYILNRSGSAEAFGTWASQRVKTRLGAQLATIVFGLLIFVDDGFNCMTVGSVMRPITDRQKISRAKLAYIIDSTAAPVCIIAPISSWAAAVTTSVPEEMGINGFQMFIRLIPLNLYALVTLVMLFLVVVFRLDYGPMLKYEKNALAGDLFTVPIGNEETKPENHSEGKVSNTVLPLLVLIGFSVLGMLYTGGFFQGATLMEAFADCDAVRALVGGAFVAMVFTFVLYMVRDVMSFKSFMECIPNGLKTMCGPMIILILAWNLSGITQLLGIATYIHDLVAASAGSLQMFLPFIIFLISVGLSFASGTSWGTFTILIPIICAVFRDQEVLLMISMAACLSGSVCGDHCSPISDTTIMSSAGAGCDHISHVITQLPYALTAAGVSAVGFLFSGIAGATIGLGAAMVVTPIAMLLLVAVILVLRRWKREDAVSVEAE